MWFKRFFINIIVEFFNALPTISGGAYEGENWLYAIIGVPLFCIFLIGCVRIFLKVIDWGQTIIARLKAKRKRR